MKLKDIVEQVNPLSNQHDLRKRAIGIINAARKAHKAAGGDGMLTPAEIIRFGKKNIPNVKREELEAVRTLLKID
jgi:hypothetical protein